LREGDGRPLRLRAHGLNGEVLSQGLPVSVVDHPGRRADLGVGVGGDRFLEEVDEASVLLQKAEQLQRSIRFAFSKGRALRDGGPVCVVDQAPAASMRR